MFPFSSVSIVNFEQENVSRVNVPWFMIIDKILSI